MRYPGVLFACLFSIFSLVATAEGMAEDLDEFTIAVIPDTQNYLDYNNQRSAGFPFDAGEMFLEQMRYIASRAKSAGGDIAFVTSVGDIWQHQISNEVDSEHAARGLRSISNPNLQKMKAATDKVQIFEMPLARQGYEIISGKVPFAVAAGNQEYDALWTDSRFPARKFDPQDLTSMGVMHVGGLDNFRSVFGSDSSFFKGKSWYVASHNGGADSAQVFSAGGYRFLNISLEFNIPDSSIEWAGEIIEKYKDLPTIITTHECLNSEGERLPLAPMDKTLIDPQDNNPEDMWRKLIFPNDQIFMVLCGHHPGKAFRVDENRFGHKVYQIMADYQSRGQALIDAGVEGYNLEGGGGDGWLRLMTFNFRGELPQVHIRTYSTHYKVFSVDLPDYANWYKAQENPDLTDEDFNSRDDFIIYLNDFEQRFAKMEGAVE